jgi:hypothetical protein
MIGAAAATAAPLALVPSIRTINSLTRHQGVLERDSNVVRGAGPLLRERCRASGLGPLESPGGDAGAVRFVIVGV